MMSPGTVPLLPRGVRSQFDKVRNCHVLLGPERVVMLDPIGAAIVQRIDGQASLTRIAHDLSEIYTVPRDVIEPDVVAFIADLQLKGFVHVTQG